MDCGREIALVTCNATTNQEEYGALPKETENNDGRNGASGKQQISEEIVNQQPKKRMKIDRNNCCLVHQASTQKNLGSQCSQYLNLPGATVFFAQQVFTKQQCERFYLEFQKLDVWASREVMIFGKKRQENRQTAMFSLPNFTLPKDENSSSKQLVYHYSGRDNIGIPAPPPLTELHRLIEHWIETRHEDCFNLFPRKGQQHFNFVLGNYYRSGRDYIGMHSDDERNLEGPILCVSLGASRFFDFHQKQVLGKVPPAKLRLTLDPGSVLVMGGLTQKHYKHGIPMQRNIDSGRISLTFRRVKEGNSIQRK